MYADGQTYYVWEVKIIGQAYKAIPEAWDYANAIQVERPGSTGKLGWGIGGPYDVPASGDKVAGIGFGGVIYYPGPQGKPVRRPYEVPDPILQPVPRKQPTPQPDPVVDPQPHGWQPGIPGWVKPVGITVGAVAAIGGGIAACATGVGCAAGAASIVGGVTLASQY